MASIPELIQRPMKHPNILRGHPTGICIHAMGEWIDLEPEDIFCIDHLENYGKHGLSCHYFVMPSGATVQSVPDKNLAYHVRGNNREMLGIEVVVAGLHTYETFLDTIAEPYMTGEQEQALVKLVSNKRREYQLGNDRLFRHKDLDPTRKRDPGKGFDWERFVSITGQVTGTNKRSSDNFGNRASDDIRLTGNMV